ncbi:PadR family transcriptional regulator [Rhodococcus sp. NPDC059968]|uniref:PadR family transcriptional regulator n=1 Tax=Rhodococcus sp. NPDC059968 TaxID=3347017 RepID=UPI00367296C1
MIAPLAVAALALLVERDMHPYEMLHLLQLRGLQRYVKIRPGSFYHAVARLERDGLLVVVGTAQHGNRPARTIYTITTEGRATLRENVMQTLTGTTHDRPLPLALAQAHHLDTDTVVSSLTERIQKLDQQLEEFELLAASFCGRPRMLGLHADFMRAMTRTEILWLRNVVEQLAATPGAADPT